MVIYDDADVIFMAILITIYAPFIARSIKSLRASCHLWTPVIAPAWFI